MSAPDYRLDGDVAMVTGAGNRIGKPIAVAAAASGASVGCVDLPSADLPGLVADISSDGARAVAVPADVTDRDQINTAVTVIERELCPLSAAVNAAGIANAVLAEVDAGRAAAASTRRQPHRGVPIVPGGGRCSGTVDERSSISPQRRQRSPTATCIRPTTTTRPRLA